MDRPSSSLSFVVPTPNDNPHENTTVGGISVRIVIFLCSRYIGIFNTETGHLAVAGVCSCNKENTNRDSLFDIPVGIAVVAGANTSTPLCAALLQRPRPF